MRISTKQNFSQIEGKVMVQSVDYFRAFIGDTYTFGAIVANHALGDVFAMGAEAQSVLAIATVPNGRERVVEETLYDVMAGVMSIVQPTGAVLVGGHSSEGAELAFGLTVNGIIDPNKVWRKNGLQPGDAIILTKSVGTGTLFAEDMRGKAKGRWVDAAIQSMLLSNQQAAECMLSFDATACTDLTGFGIIGHLIKMTKASQVNAEIYMDAIPLLDGAMDTVKAVFCHHCNLRTCDYGVRCRTLKRRQNIRLFHYCSIHKPPVVYWPAYLRAE